MGIKCETNLEDYDPEDFPFRLRRVEAADTLEIPDEYAQFGLGQKLETGEVELWGIICPDGKVGATVSEKAAQHLCDNLNRAYIKGLEIGTKRTFDRMKIIIMGFHALRQTGKALLHAWHKDWDNISATMDLMKAAIGVRIPILDAPDEDEMQTREEKNINNTVIKRAFKKIIAEAHDKTHKKEAEESD